MSGGLDSHQVLGASIRAQETLPAPSSDHHLTGCCCHNKDVGSHHGLVPTRHFSPPPRRQCIHAAGSTSTLAGPRFGPKNGVHLKESNMRSLKHLLSLLHALALLATVGSGCDNRSSSHCEQGCDKLKQCTNDPAAKNAECGCSGANADCLGDCYFAATCAQTGPPARGPEMEVGDPPTARKTCDNVAV